MDRFKLDENNLPEEGKAGKATLQNYNAQEYPIEGLPYADAKGNTVNTIFGTDKPENFAGTAQSDLIVTGSEKDNNPDKVSTTTINGRGGHDVAVLQGAQSDYVISMPGIEDYPSLKSDSWKNQNTLYGSVFALEDVRTGDKIVMNGVSNVVFDPDGKVKEGDNLNALQNGLNDKSLTQLSAKDMVGIAESGLEKDELKLARLSGTSEAQALAEKGLPANFTDKDLKQLNEGIAKLDIDTSARSYIADTAPEKIAPMASLGISAPSMGR